MAYEALGAIVAELERQQRQGFVEKKKGKGKGFSFEVEYTDEQYSVTVDLKPAPEGQDMKHVVRELARIAGEGKVYYRDYMDLESMPLEQYLRGRFFDEGRSVSYWSNGDGRGCGFNYDPRGLYMKLTSAQLPVEEIRDALDVIAGCPTDQAIQQ